MSAESILHCVEIAMEDDQRRCVDRPYCQSAIRVARELINKSVNALDSVELQRAIASLAYPTPDGTPLPAYQVKEPPAVYIH